MEKVNLNVPSITVNEIVSMLTMLYCNVINNGDMLNSVPTPFLWGPAGIGKSEAIVQLAKKLEEKTKKKVTIIDVRLLLFSPVDLRGVPVADEHKKFSNWLMPKIFDMESGDDHINILFLDELSAATQSIQAAAYQICLDRKIGEHRLPANCIVIAAGNRTTDQSVSYKMPKALCNRLMHFEVKTNYKAWRDWAELNGIDRRIIGYLAFDNSRLYVEPSASDTAYPTPRSWSFVSRLIKNSGDELLDIQMLIAACIGMDTALEFVSWVNLHKDLPNVEDVLNGRCLKNPQTYDALFAFMSSLIACIKSRKDDITVQELENACAYIKKFPTDFAMNFYTDLNELDAIRLKLMRCSSYQKWLTKNKESV